MTYVKTFFSYIFQLLFWVEFQDSFKNQMYEYYEIYFNLYDIKQNI